MKSKVYLFGLLCTIAIVFGGCKAKQSAYKQAYETAQARSIVSSQTPTEPSRSYSADSYSADSYSPDSYSPPAIERPQTAPANDPFQTEKVTAVDGRNLLQYSVVIGSFVNRTNAESLKNRMQAQGYSPVVAQNEKGMYRVIVATFDSRAEATAQRNTIKSRYPEFYDAWLLNRAY